jgi:competence protein ComEA
MKIDPSKMVIAVVGIIAGAALGLGALALRDRSTPAPIKIVPPAPSATPLPTETPAPIQVYVSGEVLAPDVYALPVDSRIKQLVEAAGGFTEMANTAVINLAQPLTDGVHVHIPSNVEAPATPPTVLSDPAPLPRSSEIKIGSGGNLVNINSAALEELDTLPGIGPVIAQKVIDYRAVNGPFSDIKAIVEVSGIGEGKFEEIQDLITVGN